MTNKILIDASSLGETRVVVVRGDRVEEFDFESPDRKQIKGNMYLGVVARVEPALQAAFVDFGGNRHGFLSFFEIHPEYYQVSSMSRQDSIEEEDYYSDNLTNDIQEDVGNDYNGQVNGNLEETSNMTEAEGIEAGLEEENLDIMEPDEILEETSRPMKSRYRRPCRIQEVIKRKQLLLVQVIKEGRGNKGAALTTYLSLAGRYSVLMPNTARGSGVSRKIVSTVERKQMREMVHELDIPEGMGAILRTAGATRTKSEIRRDFDYLLKQWEAIRASAVSSAAPTLVYEEGNLIKRAIRDLYSDDVDNIIVSGEAGYRDAKNFMRALMPSHARAVQRHKSPISLFTYFDVERQLEGIFKREVELPSGGHIVISQTEALVAIYVNSGRATKEHSVENTALQTNMEAAREIARQLRLRDLAGLIVVDFIDMEERRNNQAVESILRDGLKGDRARLQVGHISPFGLLEMSRQRLRTGVLESAMSVCPGCAGTGVLRSDESQALHILRAIAGYLLNDSSCNLLVKTRVSVALRILNQKRSHIIGLEKQFGVTINVIADDQTLPAGCNYTLEKEPQTILPRQIASKLARRSKLSPVPSDTVVPDPDASMEVGADKNTGVEAVLDEGSITVVGLGRNGKQQERSVQTEAPKGEDGTAARTPSKKTRRPYRRRVKQSLPSDPVVELEPELPLSPKEPDEPVVEKESKEHIVEIDQDS